MFKSKLSKVIVSLLRRIAGVTRSGAKRLMRAMLQALMAMGRRARLPMAGFVLPTVTMVLLVVILLTVAITLRSFDRANTARNVRVNQQVLAAATPALDRAKAKIQFLLYEDPQRPTATPSDAELYARIANPVATPGTPDVYSFGDEERLIVKADLNSDNTADATNPTNSPIGPAPAELENEAINTAWRYAVDTNNDSKFDTFTLYGIYFRTPKRSSAGNNVGDFTRARKPLDARTPPMSVKGLNPNCVQGGGTVASLVGDSGWYKIDGKLKKSFFVYTVNVPITSTDITANGLDPTKYQPFTGTTSISALEYQQDQSRIPLANNAVVYEDDLDISPGPNLNLNGRIFTNSNLLVTGLNNPNTVQLYQVSSQDSCFYEQENSKIVVGGNVVNGWSGSNLSRNAVGVHLFKKFASNRNAEMLSAAKKIQNTNPTAESANNNSLQVLYNNQAYAARLALLVAAQMGEPLPATGLPDPNVQPTDPFSVQRKPDTQTREQALQEYFKQMLRKVPFAEVGPTAPIQNPTGNYGLPWNPTPPNTSPLTGTQDTLRPVDNTWMLPDAAATGIQLRANQLETTVPEADGTPPPEETFLGDRVVAGNNLPALRWDGSKFISTPETIPGSKWNSAATAAPDRTHEPQVVKLADVGATERSGFWEGAAAETPKNPLDGVGGLRVITSAGVYERRNSFLPPPTWINPSNGTLLGNVATDAYDDPTTADAEQYPVVWPDTMPMSPLGLGSQVYDNDANAWVNLPATAPAAAAAIPPGGLPPTGLPEAALPTIDRITKKYAKGDLRMRATAVYHYAQNGGYDPTVPTSLDNVKPFACVSSYYDPSTASTARNLSTLPAGTDVSGDTALGTPGDQVGSNNGVVYGPPTDRTGEAQTTPGADGLLGGSAPNELQRQANYVFPDGRFANEPLRKALMKAPGERRLADRAAIDSTQCALDILAAPNTVSAIFPHGAIKEVAFLNAREIKAIDRDDWTTPNVNETFTLSSPLVVNGTAQPAKLTGNYNQPLEERQPLEIRATQLDINVLRSNAIAGEPLLPYSGIIYASRDDAQPDRSARIRGAAGIDEGRSATESPTDPLLDPTRKPNGILLVNGAQLARIPALPPTVANVVREKGLTLASNLPVYIKGDFNLHTQREFGGDVTQPFDFTTFYNRAAADLNKNFACRPNDPRLNGNCTTGDDWRPANVLADAITLLSQNYRFGFRNEGDFDLRNNAGAAAVLPRRQQGFFNNNFVTNGLTSGAFSPTGARPATAANILLDANYARNNNALNSSYFNNFVTPVQRRGSGNAPANFPEYLMEVCTKLPVSACTDNDWFVDPQNNIRANVGVPSASWLAGTTARPPAAQYQRFPRRVAFQRNRPTDANLVLDANNNPTPLGISGGNVVPGQGDRVPNSLWFATATAAGGNTVNYGGGAFLHVFNRMRVDGSGAELPVLAAASSPWANGAPPSPYNGSQPLLLPVLQIQFVAPEPDSTNTTTTIPKGGQGQIVVKKTGWIPRGIATTFNMILAANDTPSRTLTPSIGDFNGGLQNLPRFLENYWISDTLPPTATDIQGAFIQFNRSAYSTAPYTPILDLGSPQQTNANTRLQSLFDNRVPPAAPVPPGPARAVVTYKEQPPDPLYRTDNATVSVPGAFGGRLPFFNPPTRNWGYDVGLLSQPPDLFTQKFTTPPSRPSPDEYFREVSRDDDWVKALMCSKLAANPTTANATSSRPSNCLP
ncbi:hormogonium polysaccharide biosynthesis protein HpsA [Microcoleus sp. S28C3]|uniref:hormogonium polysaccharide biosynthesis protein HpsA n=1 Tax=Microcoleus sp. S28C3 TaxID=3055414 RepID=UPI002FD4AB0A